MVAILLRLKLSLLRNSLRRSVWRTVGLVLGLLYALSVVAMVIVGLVALRWADVDLAADVTVVAFSLLSLGWLGFSLLVFGVDETVDPSRFALLPVRARDLMPGLLVGGLVGSTGIATVLISLVLFATWSRDALAVVGVVPAVLLGVTTCFLLSRAGTAAFTSFLSSRRFRDLAFVLLALFGVGIGLGANLIGGFASAGPAVLRRVLGDVATVLGWSPFGWAWSIPADLARGQWPAAGLHLALAAGLVVVLWLVWGHFLSLRLTEPIERGGEGGEVRAGTFVERLYPSTPAGGVALRTLRYWRRDPRYLAGIFGYAIGPLIFIVIPLVNRDSGTPLLGLFAPLLMAWFLGLGMAQDLSYDGSAIWLHASSGVSGVDDRTGRVLSMLTIFVPLLFAILVLAFVMSGQWSLLPAVVGLTVSLSLGGLGVGCVVGVLWQWPAPPPGANPFTKGNSGGLPALASAGVTTGLTVVVALPTLALAIGGWWIGWLNYLALVVGVATGFAALIIGIRRGGQLLDRRWPEVLSAVRD
jgi:ABC-2 type transport system permease protein